MCIRDFHNRPVYEFSWPHIITVIISKKLREREREDMQQTQGSDKCIKSFILRA